MSIHFYKCWAKNNNNIELVAINEGLIKKIF